MTERHPVTEKSLLKKSYDTSGLDVDLDERRGSRALLRLSKELNLLDIQLTLSHSLPRHVCPLYQL